MQREIGSNFWISPEEINKESLVITPKQFGCDGSDFVLMSTGRSATLFVLDDIEKRNANVRKIAVVPSFTCHTVIEPFLAKGYEVYSYHVDKGLMADAYDILKQIRRVNAGVLIFHKFFGWDTIRNMDAIIPQLKELGIVTIEDCTQNLYSTFNKENVDYYVGSIRKWCGVPDGGFAVCRHGEFENKPQCSDKDLEQTKREAAILKYKYLFENKGNKQTFLSKYRKAEDILNNQDNYYSISELSTRLQSNLDVEYVINQRKENFKSLVDGLEGCNVRDIRLIFNELNKNEVPLYCPILCSDRKTVQSYLARHDIFAPIIWRKADCCPIVDVEADYLYAHILCIPIDQRYDSDDMKKVISVLGNLK